MNAWVLLDNATNTRSCSAQGKSSVGSTELVADKATSMSSTSATDDAKKRALLMEKSKANNLSANGIFKEIQKQQAANGSSSSAFLQNNRNQKEIQPSKAVGLPSNAHLLMQREHEKQAIVNQANLLRLLQGSDPGSDSRDLQGQYETEYLQQIQLEALVQQRRQETLAKFALAQQAPIHTCPHLSHGSHVARQVTDSSNRLMIGKFQRQDSALQNAILLARAEEEVRTQQERQFKELVDRGRQFEKQKQLEKFQQDHAAAILQMASYGSENSVLNTIRTKAKLESVSDPANAILEANSICGFLEQQERQRVLGIAQRQQKIWQQNMQSLPSSKSDPRHPLGQQVGFREGNDPLGAVVAKLASAKPNSSTVDRSNKHSRSRQNDLGSSPQTKKSLVAASFAAYEADEMRKLSMRDQKHLGHEQQGERINGHMQDAMRSCGDQNSSKSTILPCRARGMPMDHTIKKAFFVIPEGIQHGAELLCSYFPCRSAGIKFRYCLYCKLPVAKRNFYKRHRHEEWTTKSDSNNKNTANDSPPILHDDENASSGEERKECHVQQENEETHTTQACVPTENSSSPAYAVTSEAINYAEDIDQAKPIVPAPSTRKEIVVEEMLPSSACCENEQSCQNETTKEDKVDNDNDKLNVSIERRIAWGQLLTKRPRSKDSTSDEMLSWIQEVLRISDLENEISDNEKADHPEEPAIALHRRLLDDEEMDIAKNSTNGNVSSSGNSRGEIGGNKNPRDEPRDGGSTTGEDSMDLRAWKICRKQDNS